MALVRTYGVRFGLVGILVALLVVSIVPFAQWFAVARPPVAVEAGDVRMTFGFRRLPLTRVVTHPVDLPPEALTAEEPVQVAAALDRDMSAAEERGEFPAQQVAVSVQSATAKSVTVAITADPSTPETIAGGVYRGRVHLTLPDGQEVATIGVSLVLRDRRALAAGAFVALLLGALLGLALKWLTETATELGRLRRQHRRLAERHGRPGTPAWATDRLDEAATVLKDGETGRVKELLASVQDQSPRLTRFADLHQRAERRLERLQAAGLTNGMHDDAEDLHLTLESARHDTDADAGSMESATQALRAVHADVIKLARRQREQQPPVPARDLADVATESTSPTPQASVRTSTGQAARRSTVRVGEWLSDHVRPVLAIASAIVVAMVGVQTQMIDNHGFSGSVSDYLGLVFWALAIEFTGVSLTEVIGKVQPTPSGR